ncbi:MAG TPA: bacteriohemerythrin [Bryobacteraceae bacterium]|nr:bacteriohemerythrin [Bryobacteraceae bacterium]
MFEWRKEFSVDIGSVDAQHQNLFAIAGELYAAMIAGQSKMAMARILDRLVQYTKMHFAHEERLMQQFGYPALEAHKAEHQALTAKVLKFQQEFEQGQVNISVQLLQFLRTWLEGHIKGSDKRYSPFLKSKAVA